MWDSQVGGIVCGELEPAHVAAFVKRQCAAEVERVLLDVQPRLGSPAHSAPGTTNRSSSPARVRRSTRSSSPSRPEPSPDCDGWLRPCDESLKRCPECAAS